MIHQIQIKNFKSLRDVTVELSPVTVLIGKSGTGKTNFASSIRFLQDLLTMTNPHLLMQLHPNYQCATNPKDATEFTVILDVPGCEELFSYRIILGADLTRHPQLESLDYGNKTIFRQSQSNQSKKGETPRWEVEPALISVPPPGPIALRRLTGIDEAVFAHTALTDAIGVYTFPFDVMKSSQITDNVRNQNIRMSGLMDDGSNYLDVLRDISRDLQNIRSRKAITAALRQINQTLGNIDLDLNQNPPKALVGHIFQDKTLTLELSQESDGFRRFYAHLLALYQKSSKQFLVFEEPENGIYPGALALLADEFKATPEAGRGQVILTTHSPSLLDHFSADQIRVVELVDLETKIGPLAEEQKESLQEELLHAGELLTVDPARRQE
ncbi:MAG: AAA family ATPase [Pirellulales bacterium]|nr:AAA family ATPase [Pirellulales bacterium]